MVAKQPLGWLAHRHTWQPHGELSRRPGNRSGAGRRAVAAIGVAMLVSAGCSSSDSQSGTGEPSATPSTEALATPSTTPSTLTTPTTLTTPAASDTAGDSERPSATDTTPTTLPTGTDASSAANDWPAAPPALPVELASAGVFPDDFDPSPPVVRGEHLLFASPGAGDRIAIVDLDTGARTDWSVDAPATFLSIAPGRANLFMQGDLRGTALLLADEQRAVLVPHGDGTGVMVPVAGTGWSRLAHREFGPVSIVGLADGTVIEVANVEGSTPWGSSAGNTIFVPDGERGSSVSGWSLDTGERVWTSPDGYFVSATSPGGEFVALSDENWNNQLVGPDGELSPIEAQIVGAPRGVTDDGAVVLWALEDLADEPGALSSPDLAVVERRPTTVGRAAIASSGRDGEVVISALDGSDLYRSSTGSITVPAWDRVDPSGSSSSFFWTLEPSLQFDRSTPMGFGTLALIGANLDTGEIVTFFDPIDRSGRMPFFPWIQHLSPDGSKIWLRYEGDDDHQRWFVAALDGSVVEIAHDFATGANNAAWSPDGTRILIATETESVIADATTGEIIERGLPSASAVEWVG